MEQEKIEKNLPEVQETELKEEKSKKIFIILIVLLLFGGTCYYYAGINNSSDIKIAKTNHSVITEDQRAHKNSSITLNNQNQSNISLPDRSSRRLAPQDDSNIKEKTEKISSIEPTEKQNKNNDEISLKKEPAEKTAQKTKFKPAGKSDLLSLAEKSSGKHDPFSYSESKFTPFQETASGSSAYPTNLPPVPGAGNMGTLPSIPTLSGVPSAGLAPPPAPKSEDLVSVKGFIGNKVIAEIDGVVEALNPNQKINNIKVLSVNPSTLTAKFEINGKTVTKTLKSLTEDYNGEVQIAKNMHD